MAQRIKFDKIQEVMVLPLYLSTKFLLNSDKMIHPKLYHPVRRDHAVSTIPDQLCRDKVQAPKNKPTVLGNVYISFCFTCGKNSTGKWQGVLPSNNHPVQKVGFSLQGEKQLIVLL